MNVGHKEKQMKLDQRLRVNVSTFSVMLKIVRRSPGLAVRRQRLEFQSGPQGLRPATVP